LKFDEDMTEIIWLVFWDTVYVETRHIGGRQASRLDRSLLAVHTSWRHTGRSVRLPAVIGCDTNCRRGHGDGMGWGGWKMDAPACCCCCCWQLAR